MIAELTQVAAPRAVRERLAVPEAAAPRARPGKAAARPPGPPVDPVVEQALRTWRTERSRHDGVSAYIVLHDTTLLAIAAARPRTPVALRRIDGIGPAKLELYGDEILAVLASLEDVVGVRAEGAP
jgi:DNA helicase-2/ATP-dependent DNA helicase PcrA